MLKYQATTQVIIQAFYAVYNSLGHGFLEKVYENALAIELRSRGLNVTQQAAIKVRYAGQVVGEYYSDLLVENCIIVELKAVDALADEHFAQLLNYLKATGIEVGLLLNFGAKPEIKRKVFETAKASQPPNPTPSNRENPRTQSG